MTTELRHRYAHTNGIRMYYVEQGDAAKRPAEE